MFVTLSILLFVAQPIKGANVDPKNNGQESGVYQQIEANQNENAAEYPYYWRFRHSRRERRIWEDEHYAAEKAAKPSNQNGKDDYWNRIIGIGTLVLAAFTIILAGISFQQYRKSRESSEKQLRAYVGIEGEPLQDNELTRFKIQNFGQTPALRVTAWFNYIVNLPERVDFTTLPPAPTEEERTHAALDPGCYVSLVEIPSEEEWARIASGMSDKVSAIWFVGQIHYIDIFGKPHWRKFRYRTNTGIRKRYTVSLCNEGNETDDTESEAKGWLKWLKLPSW